MKVINIKWDVDDGEMSQNEIAEILTALPTEVEIPHWIDSDDHEDVGDWLTEEYGYCHDGFKIVEE